MSEIKVDTLTGKTTANDITVTVGASATMSLEQGLAKAWFQFNQSTPATGDSFGVSSISDDATGLFTTTLSSAMGTSDDYVVVGNTGNTFADPSNRTCASVPNTTTQFKNQTTTGGGTKVDMPFDSVTVHGDLA